MLIQFQTKFKNRLSEGFKAALNPSDRIFLNFAKNSSILTKKGLCVTVAIERQCYHGGDCWIKCRVFIINLIGSYNCPINYPITALWDN